jgi:nitroreductase
MNNKSNDKLDFLLARRSVRVYTPGEIPDEAVTRILEAAMAAPSAMTRDPWRFIVVRNPETLSKITAALPGGKMIQTAPLAIVVCGDLEAAFESQLSYLLQDCSACLENLLLGAHALSLGACWVGVHPDESALKQLKNLFSLPASIVPVAVVSIGHPGEHLEARTRFNKTFVHLENW